MPDFGQDPVQVDRKMRDAVNADRDTKISAGFTFNGNHFDWDADSKARINSAAMTAQWAIGRGEDKVFEWILSDDTTIKIDASGMIAVAEAGMAHEEAAILEAHSLKTHKIKPETLSNDAKSISPETIYRKGKLIAQDTSSQNLPDTRSKPSRS